MPLLSYLVKQGAFDADLENAVNANFRALQVTGFPNYIATESGSNNALAITLYDSQGTYVTLAAGLRVCILLGHTLQAGANTIALNGGSAKDLKSHFNPANNIGTAYAAAGILDCMYDGTRWLDMSQ